MALVAAEHDDLAERIATAEISIDQRLVHDQHTWRAGAVAGAERATTHERHAERPEVVRRDQLKVRVRLLIRRQRRIPLDAQATIRRAGERSG